MTVHFHHEVEKLHDNLLHLSAVVEENIHNGIRAFETRDTSAAEAVIEKDNQIDQMEVELEEECLKLLALYQPVAIDLRCIVAAMKINNDLERVGDLATNIAKRVKTYAQYPDIESPFDLEQMAQSATDLLRRSLDAFVNLDIKIAEEIRVKDDDVDAYNDQAQQVISDAIKREPQKEDGYIQLVWVAKHLERVADHATNIAEDIIYMLQGKIVRHTGKPATDTLSSKSR